jgi:SAM-dependent methyltransferase
MKQYGNSLFAHVKVCARFTPVMMDASKGSPERFGFSWDRFSELTPAQEQQFKLWTTPIDLATSWWGVRFLDAGCGMGRNAYWPMKHGAHSGVAIDLDDRSLEWARRNLA